MKVFSDLLIGEAKTKNPSKNGDDYVMFKIPLIKPYLPLGTEEKVLEVLRSGYLTEGPITAEFEEQITKYVGTKYAIAVTSCTTGLEIALRALGIGAGDEVIVPDYTYPATADAVMIVGAKAVIVDVNPKTMLIDYDLIEQAITPNTKAIMPVSEFGNPLDYDRLNKIKNKYGVLIVEDAACALGSEFKGAKTGKLADITVFSFHPRKFITTGEGGMITTDNSEWAEWMISYKHFGMGVQNERLTASFERVGTNYKLSNILAALGLGQLEHIEKLLQRRRDLATRYIQHLKDIKGITIPETTEHGIHSYQTFSVFVENRDEIMKKMREKGIEAQIGTYALHLHTAFQKNELSKLSPQGYLGSLYAFKHCLALPLYYEMTEEEQVKVIGTLNTIYFEYAR